MSVANDSRRDYWIESSELHQAPLHGVLAQAKLRTDLPIREALRDQHGDLMLSLGKSRFTRDATVA
jgi:hypothetical protein